MSNSSSHIVNNENKSYLSKMKISHSTVTKGCDSIIKKGALAAYESLQKKPFPASFVEDVPPRAKAKVFLFIPAANQG